uniref:Myristylated protein n=1 Tax=Strongyloides venezuelensis TaxID=75913 RepID=A0A0K0FYP9_STRVS
MNEDNYDCFQVCSKYGKREFEIGQTWCQLRCKDLYFSYSLKDIIFMETIYMKKFMECSKKTNDPVKCGNYVDNLARVLTPKDIIKLNSKLIKYHSTRNGVVIDEDYMKNECCRGKCIRQNMQSNLELESFCKSQCESQKNVKSIKKNTMNDFDLNVDEKSSQKQKDVIENYAI